jgi:CheY-like chemotaxis protein
MIGLSFGPNTHLNLFFAICFSVELEVGSMYILVVDNDHASRGCIQRILLELGHQGIPCDDGVVAQDTLRLIDFRLIIADQDSTRPSGTELCRKIRAATNHPPCVIISTSTPGRHANEITLAGANGCLSKPVQKEDLQALLGSLLPKPGVVTDL